MVKSGDLVNIAIIVVIGVVIYIVYKTWKGISNVAGAITGTAANVGAVVAGPSPASPLAPLGSSPYTATVRPWEWLISANQALLANWYQAMKGQQYVEAAIKEETAWQANPARIQEQYAKAIEEKAVAAPVANPAAGQLTTVPKATPTGFNFLPPPPVKTTVAPTITLPKITTTTVTAKPGVVATVATKINSPVVPVATVKPATTLTTVVKPVVTTPIAPKQTVTTTVKPTTTTTVKPITTTIVPKTITTTALTTKISRLI